jgi:signal transduction histidine kinase
MTPTVRRPPAWRIYLYVLLPFVVIVSLVGTVTIGSVAVLGAVRAYVTGESLWSKARNEAVQQLLGYAEHGDATAFQQFERALAVPLGDRRAREAMLRDPPDVATAREGLLAGGNHPDDIGKMIELFHYFGDKPLFKDSLNAWIEGDRLIARLQVEARQLRLQRTQGASEADLAATVASIRDTNADLFHAEIAFTRHLGQASRTTEHLLMGSTVALALALSIVGYLVMRRGLKREQQYQREQARALRRWELAVEGAGLGLFEVDAANGQVTLDARAAVLYGLPPHRVELSGTELMARIAPEDRHRADEALRDAARSRNAFRLTVRTQLPDGGSRQLESLGGQPAHGRRATDRPERLIGVVRDITQEMASAQLAAERDAAERVAASQRAFLSRLSHELRTPLNAILGFAQLLAMDHLHPLPPTQHQQVNWILDAGQQLLKLVEDVLDLSKVEAGEIGITLQHCDLGTVLDHSLVLVESARMQHGVTIERRVASNGAAVVADPQRLQQVLVNLLTNACKYNRPGGRVTVDTREASDHVCIDIADNGIGLSEQDAKELFQPFRRVAAASAKVEGTGLGLYIVKQLVERMGGAVTVHSEPGQGSRFSVSLPKAV